MASQLSLQDSNFIDAHQTIRIGELPYEDGVWGLQANRDFVHFELSDENNNLIEFKNLPLLDFEPKDNNISFYPGNHIRNLGYESGKFVAKYIFLRKLAGSESPVLVRTKDTTNHSKGDVYTELDNIYIREDGIVFAGSKEQYNENPEFAEQLAVEDLTYLIDEISSDRTEVRLKAKNIKGSYIDDFVDIQTEVTMKDVESNIKFITDTKGIYDSTQLQIEPEEGGFIFTSKMKRGTIVIPDVYKIDQISVPAKTNINLLKNPNGESYKTDGLSNILKLGNQYEWDASLHSEAVGVENWTDGFLDFSNTNDTHFGTAGIGYHAHWIKGEGVAGGICMKFPDTNEPFTSLDVWPNGQAYRKLSISQEMLNLQGQGVKHEDIINISLDVKSTVANKGVQIAIAYPNEPLVEPLYPSAPPPPGYYDVSNPGPTEPIPTSAPEGYSANTEANAYAIEDKPPQSEFLIRNEYGDTVPTPFDPGLGTTTEIWGGAGAWKITDIKQVEVPTNLNESGMMIVNQYFWSPNLAENSMNGTLSDLGQWIWNADPDNPPYSYGAWGQNPAYANSMEAPSGVTGIPEAINFHPAQDISQGAAFYPRNTMRGENRGWQTVTSVADQDNGHVLLFKDDLIWEQKHAYTTNDSKLELYVFDDYFNGIRDVIIDEGTNNQRTLYDDIFRHGFIQSVTRVPEGDGGGLSSYFIQENWFLIFYNNGDVDFDGNPTLNSNRFFYVHKTNGVQGRPHDGENKKIHLLKDIDAGLNLSVIDNELKMEWFFKAANNKGQLTYYIIVGDEYYRKNDGDAKGDLYDAVLNGPTPMESGFPGLPAEPNGVIEKNGFGRYRAIVDDEVHKFKSNAGDGIDTVIDLQDEFMNCGIKRTDGADLTYGIRNPGANNYVGGNPSVIYDDGTGEFSWPDDPLQVGALSPLGLWRWDGYEWRSLELTPPRYSYNSPITTTALAQPTNANAWERIDLEIPIPEDWVLGQKWYLYINGHGSVGGFGQGVVWVDNMYVDFTLRDQSTTQPVFRPFSAQIEDINVGGTIITLNKSLRDHADIIGAIDADQDNNPDIFNLSDDTSEFNNFKVSYTNLNPLDLRTYLKFGKDLFLTTNFKQDKINVSNFPHGVVYKLYNPLPESYEKFNECIVVKEMANPLVERVEIIDFVPEEEPSVVLRSPDLNNAESVVQNRQTQYKTETDILTSDKTISDALRNEFLSQSLDSVQINTDYSQYQNFINFSSIESRIINFKKKLENIEDYKISSASYIGVSGSSNDLNLYHYKIEETKNNFDDFETYMYNESSSYTSGSLGQFYDNAWPKTGGSGTLTSPYVLAHTTSSQADTWYTNAITSASAYDRENGSKLSNLIPMFIREDANNQTYLKFTDMIGQHFDHIWEYINALSDIYDRREKLDEGISKDLLWSVAKSLGWDISNSKDLVSLPRYALGKEVTGSAFSDYSATSERDVSREIWSRIINNMPFFLKNKGTVKALKGLINIYGIPSTILRVKEYGGPALPDNSSPRYEISRKFTKALDFRSSQYVKTTWPNDSVTGRKPDTIEIRFRSATGSNQILLQKEDTNNQDWFIRLKNNDSTDDYGYVSFMLSGSKVGVDQGQYKEITSSALPIYDGDFHSVMVRRISGSASSHSYELHVGKYDNSRSKIHLYSTSTMDVTQAASSSFSNAWTGSGDIYIGGKATVADVGIRLSGSVMEYRHWTETLNTASFKNHVRNPKAYDGNTISSSYQNLSLRYSFDDDKNLNSDTQGIRDISSNQTSTYSGSHSGFTGNFFRSVVDELKTHIPSIGALGRSTDKIRIESNKIKSGFNLSSEHRSTLSQYDTAPNDSNKVGIWFAPTDVINTDIINSVGDLRFDDYLGDPRDRTELHYRGLEYTADNYWKKYTAPNNFWDYMRLIKYYDQSLYPQLRKLIPARAKPDIGLLIEPNILERPKVIMGKSVDYENRSYTSSIDIGTAVDGLITITGSYNHGTSISDYSAYTGRIDMYSYETGSSVVSASGANIFYEASGSEARDLFIGKSIWSMVGKDGGDYKHATMSFAGGKGETISGSREVIQPYISGSRIYEINQRKMSHYSSSLSASLFKSYSSSYYWSDLDNYSNLYQGLRNSFYEGVLNTTKTSIDGKTPIEIIVAGTPTKLVTTEEGETTLKTGVGIVSDFKEKPKKQLKKKKLKRGLKGMTIKPETDQDRKKQKNIEKHEKELKTGKDGKNENKKQTK